MSWLAKINLDKIVMRLGSFRSALLLILLILTCSYCGYRFGNFFHSYQIQTMEQQKQRLNKLYQQQIDGVKRIHTLEVELELERMANIKSQSIIKELSAEFSTIKKELTFYQKVMAPEKQADGLVIDDLSISTTKSANHYRFQVTLVQQLIKRRYAKGFVELVIKGSLNGKPSQYSLQEVSSLTKKELSFSFKYFQILEGDFTLPEGFVPEQISISATLPKGRWQKYNRIDQDHGWQQIMSEFSQSS